MEHFFPQIQVKTRKKDLYKKWNSFLPQIQVKTKKKVFSKSGTLFPEFHCSIGQLRSDAHQSQIIGGGCRCRPYSNYWGGFSQIIGGDISPNPPSRVSAPLVLEIPNLACGLVFINVFQKADFELITSSL